MVRDIATFVQYELISYAATWVSQRIGPLILCPEALALRF
jgi:hypothetical protein